MLGCGRSRDGEPDSVRPFPVRGAVGGGAKGSETAGRRAPGAPAAAAPDCLATGHWSLCQVQHRLEMAGMVPQPEAARQGPDALGTPAAFFRLGSAELAIHLFPDSAARRRATARLDSTRFIPQARPLSMRSETTLIESDNLAALLSSRNEHQRERVSDALTAGPPQP